LYGVVFLALGNSTASLCKIEVKRELQVQGLGKAMGSERFIGNVVYI
jgi:hypothetical protein